MKDMLEPMPQHVQALLREAPRPRPPDGAKERVLAQMVATLAASPSLSPAAPRGTYRMRSRFWRLFGSWGLPASAAAFALGAGSGALVVERTHRQPLQPERVAVTVRAAQEPLPLPAPEKTSSGAQGVVKTHPASHANYLRTLKPSAPPVRVLAAAQPLLAQEQQLLETARTALVRREIPAALAALREHTDRFPAGQLIQERDSLWIQVLIASDEREEAQARAQAFHERFPDSLLGPLVDEALRQ
jgi:hypothetical protein